MFPELGWRRKPGTCACCDRQTEPCWRNLCLLMILAAVGVVIVIGLIVAFLFYSVDQWRGRTSDEMDAERRARVTTYFRLAFQTPTGAVQGWLEVTLTGMGYNITSRVTPYDQCNLTVVERVANVPTFSLALYALDPGEPLAATVAEGVAALVDANSAKQIGQSLMAADVILLSCAQVRAPTPLPFLVFQVHP